MNDIPILGPSESVPAWPAYERLRGTAGMRPIEATASRRVACTSDGSQGTPAHGARQSVQSRRQRRERVCPLSYAGEGVCPHLPVKTDTSPEGSYAPPLSDHSILWLDTVESLCNQWVGLLQVAEQWGVEMSTLLESCYNIDLAGQVMLYPPE